MTAKTLRNPVCCFTVALALSCSPADQEPSGLAELERAIDAFYESIESGDNARRAEMFTDGAMMLPNNGTIIRGKDSVGEVVRGGEGWVFRIRDLERIELDLGGDLAYTVNEYEYTWHSEGDEPTWHPTKNIHVWRRQADGSWKLHLDIWNSSER